MNFHDRILNIPVDPEKQRDAMSAPGFMPEAYAAGHRDARHAAAEIAMAADGLLAACKEALAVVDEAYAATGFSKVAKTSEQRMRIEAAIAAAEPAARDGDGDAGAGEGRT